MNILFTNFHPGNGGGHTTYLTCLFRNLKKVKQDNFFLAVPESSKLNADLKADFGDSVFDVDFPAKPREVFAVFRNVRRVAGIIKKNEIDVVHVNGNPDHKVVMLCKCFYQLNFKIVRTKHDSKRIKSNFFYRLLYRTYTDHFIVVSFFQKKEVSSSRLMKKLSVIHNGIDLEHFSPRAEASKLKCQLGIGSDDVVFVSVAGSSLHKGWQYLVEAASMLDDDRKCNIKIIIAGNLPSDSVVEQYVVSKGMQDNVIFYGFIRDVREVVSIADLGFVLSPEFEAISFACREMMALGKPVMVSDCGGLPENIDDKVNGWIVQAGDAHSIKVVLDGLKGADLKRMSSNARLKAASEFGEADFIKKTYQIYKLLS